MLSIGVDNDDDIVIVVIDGELLVVNWDFMVDGDDGDELVDVDLGGVDVDDGLDDDRASVSDAVRSTLTIMLMLTVSSYCRRGGLLVGGDVYIDNELHKATIVGVGDTLWSILGFYGC